MVRERKHTKHQPAQRCVGFLGVMTDFNEETVGTGIPEEPTSSGTKGNNYGAVIEHLRAGGLATRTGWSGKGMFIFRQVPSKVPAAVVPKMSSLPPCAKAALEGTELHYQNQIVIVKPDGSINSWVASSSDTFAEDWEIFEIA